MKRYVIVFIIVLMLTACKPDPASLFDVDLDDLTIEVGRSVDYSTIFVSEEELVVDDSSVNYDLLGTYPITVTILENTYQYNVIIVDTTTPVIHIPEGFVTVFELYEDIDLSGITVTDNYDQTISFVSNIHEIFNDEEGYYTLTIAALDSSGNFTTKAITIRYIDITPPELDILISEIEYDSFHVEFVEYDPDYFKLCSSYKVFEGSEVIRQGTITDTFEFDITGLKQNTEYVVYIYFDFQYPNQPEDDIFDVVSLTTDELYAPELYFENGEIIDSSSFTGKLKVVDPDDLIDGIHVALYDTEDTLIEELNVYGTSDIHFEGLDAGRDYFIVIDYDYNFYDGLGVQEYDFNYEFQTSHLANPVIEVLSVDLFLTELHVNVSITDSDNTISELKVILIEGSTILEEIFITSADTQVVFDELTANTTYEIRVVGTYSVEYGIDIEQHFYEDNHSTLTN